MVSTTSLRRRRIDFAYLLRSPARLLAFGFGLGLWPRGPGTLASLATIPLYRVLAAHMGSVSLLVLVAVLFVVGVWACQRTGRDIGVEDHGGMVLDEIVAMLLILVFVPSGFVAQIIAFALFRVFDIFKPGPIRYVEVRVRGGLGVMVDDILAAFLVLLCIAFWTFFIG